MRLRASRSLALALPAAVVVALSASASVALADTTSPSAAPSAGAGSVLTIGILQDIDSANPFTGITSSAYETYQIQYPTLTDYSAKDFSIVPGLAQSWEESADKKTWTYTIRPGLKWSDGQPLTAKDAAYTFNRILKGAYEKTNFSSYTSNIIKAEAPNDTTLVLTVDKPSPIMEKLYVYILPEHIWSKIDEKAVSSYKNEGTPESPTVAGGSYFMVERKVGQFIRYKANPNYFRGKPAVDELVFKVFKNADAMGQALKKGEIDFAQDLEKNVYDAVKDAPGITGAKSAALGFNELAFNTGAALDDGTPIGDGNPLLKDKNLRVALQYAVDRQALVDKVLGGDGIPGDMIIPPAYSEFHQVPPTPYTYDPEKAKSLLDAAGYPVGADGVRADSKGNRLSFRLFGRTDSDTSKKAVEFLKGYLAAVGVETTVKMVSEDALTEIIGQGNFDMFEWGWVVEPDPNYQLSTFTCASRSYKDGDAIYANLSDSFYCNPAYDKLNEQQQTETDSAKRAAIVKQMQQMLYDDAPYLITYYPNGHEAYRSDRFTGFVSQPEKDGSLIYQYGTWSYENVKPVSSAGEGTQEGSGSSSSSSGPGWIIPVGVIVGLAVVAGLVALFLRRGRDSDLADDRE